MRLIDADELNEYVGREALDTREKIFALVDRMPTVESRPHGKWIDVPKYKGYYVCSKCLERLDGDFERFEQWEMIKDNFCRVCGSDNRGEGEAE